MDKKSIGAIAIIVLLFMGFMYINHKESTRYQVELAAYEERMAIMEAQRAESAEAERLLMGDSVEASDSTAVALQKAKSVMMIGESLTAAKVAKESTITIENDVMILELTSKGAQPKSVKLKNYTKYAPKGERTELIEMFDPADAQMAMSFFIRNGLNNVNVNTAEYVFTPLALQSVEGGKRQSFILEFGEGASMEYIYTIYDTEDESRDYLIDFDVKFHNVAPIMANQQSVKFDWKNRTYQNERGFSNENTYTTLSYHKEGESGISELGVSTEEKSDDIAGEINWIAFKQQFFSSVFIAPSHFSSADIAYSTAKEGSGYMKSYSSQMELPYDASCEGYKLGLFYGPNQYYVLKNVSELEGYSDLRLQELIPLGWGIFGWVNKWFVIPVFDLLREYIASFGLIILILAVLVKLIISPLTYNSYVSMAKMRVMKPEVDEITAKYPKQEDAMKRQQATMELYKKVGVNPMGGCLPMLIQMPIIIAMFRFFPASIELRDQSFLWAHDLSSYDSILQLPFTIPFYGDHVSLFALLMSVVMFFYSKMNYEQSASSQPQMAGMKFMMLYMMPVMMLLWFNSYSSGLCYYYFLANVLTIGQTMIIRNMVDDEKIHAILKANAAKKRNPKKSKFQQKYESMLAEAELAQKSKKR